MNIVNIRKFYLISLIFSIVITSFGFFKLKYSFLNNLSDIGFIKLVLSLFLIFLPIYISNKLFKIHSIVPSLILIILIALISENFVSIISIFLFCISSYVLGLNVYKFICKNNYNKFSVIFFVLGFGIYGTFVSLIAHVPFSNIYFYITLLLIPIIINYKLLLNLIFKFNLNLLKINNFNIKSTLIYSFSILYIIVAFMPETGYDALAMHLFVPGHMLHRFKWSFDVDTYAFAVMPMLTDWLYSIVYILGGETSARLLNVIFILLCTKLITEIINYVARGDGSLWGALFFLTCPLTFAIGSSLFIDSLLCLFVLSAVYIMLMLINNNQIKISNIIVIGLLLSFIVSTKSVGIINMSVIIAFVFLYKHKFLYQYKSGNLTIIILILLAIGLIPYINAFLISGNPVFPFYNGIFKSIYYIPSNFDNPLFKSGISYRTLYDITFNSGKFLESGPGASGFTLIFILIPSIVFLILKKNKNALLLGLCGLLMFILIFQFQSYLRYVFPVYAIFFIFIGISLSELKINSPLLYNYSVLILILSLLLNLMFINTAANYKNFPIEILINKESKASYIKETIPIKTAVEYINSLTTEAPVLVMSNPNVAGLKVDALYPIWYNVKLQFKMIEAKTPEKMIELIKDYGVSLIILDTSWEPYWAKGYWGNNSVTKLVSDISVPVFNVGTISVRILKN